MPMPWNLWQGVQFFWKTARPQVQGLDHRNREKAPIIVGVELQARIDQIGERGFRDRIGEHQRAAEKRLDAEGVPSERSEHAPMIP